LPCVRTRVNSVSAMPGSMVVTRTPVPCRSLRRFSENWLTKALVPPYTLPPGYGYTPATELTLMIAPRRSTSVGSRRWVRVTRAVMLVSIITRQSSSEACWAGAVPSARPALLTSTSIPAKPSGSAAIAASIAAVSRTSNTAGCTLAAPSSSTRACRRSPRRPVATTFQPVATNWRAAARPKPEVAPVMSTVLDIADSLQEKPADSRTIRATRPARYGRDSGNGSARRSGGVRRERCRLAVRARRRWHVFADAGGSPGRLLRPDGHRGQAGAVELLLGLGQFAGRAVRTEAHAVH